MTSVITKRHINCIWTIVIDIDWEMDWLNLKSLAGNGIVQVNFWILWTLWSGQNKRVVEDGMVRANWLMIWTPWAEGRKVLQQYLYSNPCCYYYYALIVSPSLCSSRWWLERFPMIWGNFQVCMHQRGSVANVRLRECVEYSYVSKQWRWVGNAAVASMLSSCMTAHEDPSSPPSFHVDTNLVRMFLTALNLIPTD